MHPQPEQESIFRTVLLAGFDLEVYLDGLRATTKKGQLFWPKKCTPDKILATPMNFTIYRTLVTKSISEKL